MSKVLKGFLGTTLVGIFFGVVVGVMYGLSTHNWPGAGGMFLGMIAMAYLWVFIIWLVFKIDDWING